MRLFFLFFSVAFTTSSTAQSIERAQADSLLLALGKIKPGPERIQTLIRLAEFHVFKPGELIRDLDSANTYLFTAEQLNKAIQSPELAGHHLLIKGSMLREKGQPAEGKVAIEQAIPLLERCHNKYLLGKAYFELQGFYPLWDSAGRAQRIRLTHQAVGAFQQAGEMEQKGHALRMLGDLYGINRENTKAIDVLTHAVAVYDSIGHQKLQGVYELLGRNYSILGDFKRSFQYTLQALKTAKAVQDSSMQLAAIHFMLGTLYRNAGRLETAIQHFKDAQATAMRHKDIPTAVVIAYYTGTCYIDINQPRAALRLLDSLPRSILTDSDPLVRTWMILLYMKAYQLDRQPAPAARYSVLLEKMLTKNTLPGDVTSHAHELLSHHYLQAGDMGKARLYLNKSLLLPHAPNSPAAANRTRILYKVDSAAGNYPSAFRYLVAYKSISDSLFNEVKSRQFQQLEVEFETAKKSDSLKMKDGHIVLLTQKNELQAANLRQSHLIRNITIAGIVLALAVTGLLYRQFRQKKQHNEVMALQNERLGQLVAEKEWLLKEVHHRVKNNLQTIVSLLELQLDTASRDARFAIQTSQNRIYATSLLHQKLYRSDNLSSVQMRTYLTEVIDHLREAYHAEDGISFSIEIAPLELDVTQGIPLGLIVNEVITNSLKYAFTPAVAQPCIHVSLTASEDMADLLITDNGIGFAPPGEDKMGLGLKLVKGLAGDIHGQVSIDTANGTKVLIRFKPRSALHSMITSNN